IPLFERDDPAVEQDVDRHGLAAEVVDDERAAVAFELQRSFADFGRLVLNDFEFLHGELATGDDGGADDLDPALVDAGEVEDAVAGGLFDDLVDAGIEQANDVAVDAERAGNP